MDFITLMLLGGLGLALYYMLQGAETDSTGYGVPPDYVDPGGGVVFMPANIESKVQEFCNAIAHAEGFGVPGAVPTTHHNPGDLGPGDCPGYPYDFHSGSNVCQLPSDDVGWAFLQNKIRNAFNGHSHVFSPSMTITQWAQKYAGDWQNWAKNVAAYLGVSPDTVISDWIAS